MGGAQIWFRFGTVVVCSCVCGLSLCGSALVQLWFRFVCPHGSQVQVRFCCGSALLQLVVQFTVYGSALVGMFGSAMIYRSIICGACVDHIVVG